MTSGVDRSFSTWNSLVMAAEECPSTWAAVSESTTRSMVEGASAALQHNIGLGGSAVVTAYRPANR